MDIVISPYSSKLRSGRTNPKNYPYWPKLVELLNHTNYSVIQVGTTGETRIEGVRDFYVDLSYIDLRELVRSCITWLSVDNFFPHFCHAEQLQPGIVLWGPSDPKVWGYPGNINLLRGRDFLRQHQYQTWEEIDFNPLAFVYAENVLPHVHKLAPAPLTRRLALV